MSTDLFNVTYNGIYSLSSDGEHGAGPYVDLDKITGAEKLGEIALENWENVGLLVNALVDQKGMKIIVHECLIKDSYWSSKYKYTMEKQFQVDMMAFYCVGKLQAITAAAIQILYKLKDKEERDRLGGEEDAPHTKSGVLLGFCCGNPTNIQLKFKFNKKPIYFSMIEQCNGTGTALYIGVHD